MAEQKKRERHSRDWTGVDWSMTDADISALTGAPKKSVISARNRLAPGSRVKKTCLKVPLDETLLQVLEYQAGLIGIKPEDAAQCFIHRFLAFHEVTPPDIPVMEMRKHLSEEVAYRFKDLESALQKVAAKLEKSRRSAVGSIYSKIKSEYDKPKSGDDKPKSEYGSLD